MQNTIKSINFKTSINLPENMTLTALAVDVKRTWPVLVLPLRLEIKDLDFILCSATSCHMT